MKLEINLNDIEVGEWGETIAEILRDEIKLAIKREVKEALNANESFPDVIRKIQEKAFNDLLKLVDP